MKIICVTSAASDTGKTTLAELLLRKLPAWAGCRITTCSTHRDAESCPKGKGCGICATQKTGFRIETDAEVLSQPGTDTARMLAAGAAKVAWVITAGDAVKKATDAALKILQECPGAVFEGNHALFGLEPDVAVMIKPDGVPLKKSAREILHRINFFVDGDFDRQLLAKILEKVK